MGWPEDSPHEMRHLTSAKLMGEFGLRCQSLEQNSVFLDSSWSCRPHGPGFSDKGPVTHGGFQSAASLPKQSNTNIWRGQKSKAYRPSKQLHVETAAQSFKTLIQNKDSLWERLAELSELWVVTASQVQFANTWGHVGARKVPWVFSSREIMKI